MEIERVETKRLVGEAIGPAHFEVVRALDSDPLVMATLGGLRSENETHEFLLDRAGHWEREGFGPWVWFERSTGAFVGRGGLKRIEIEGVPEVEVGYAIIRERWGEGFATEIARASVAASDELRIPELVGLALPSNTRSRRVLEKAGFAYEGELAWFALTHVLYRRLSSPAAPG